MVSLKSIQKHWNHFFFEEVSALPLGVYRICYGLLVFWYALTLRPELLNFFGIDGMLTLADQFTTTGSRLNLFQVLPASDGVIFVLWWALLVGSLFITLGLGTRLFSILNFILLASFHHRNTLILNGGDTVLRVMGFLMIFAPAGRALSLERIIRILRGKEDKTPPKVSAWTLRLLQFQFSWIYLATFAAKVGGNLWLNGTSLYYVLRLPEFHRFHIPFLYDQLWALRLFTWGALLIELALGTLIWVKEFRRPLIVLGILLHLGIEYTMIVPLFEWIMIAGLLLFVDDETWKKLGSYFYSKKRESVFYDGDCIFCLRWKSLLEALDLRHSFDWINFRDKKDPAIPKNFDYGRAEIEMLVKTQTNQILGGFYALRHILKRLPSTFWMTPFLYIPGIAFIGTRGYAWVARHRYLFLGRICSLDHGQSSCALPQPAKKQ